MVPNETLLFAASWSFPQLSRDPLLVAISGKTSDFRSRSRTKFTPVWIGFASCGVVCDCVLADGASGTAPGSGCCATLTEHIRQQLAAIKRKYPIAGQLLLPITRFLFDI